MDANEENSKVNYRVSEDNQKIILIKDFLEKELINLPPDNTEKESKCYISGIIGCLEYFKTIDKSEANNLYAYYVY